MTEDELAELAELRRRAYGPDADIADDPVARVRLAELEAASHREHPGPALDLPPVEAARSREGAARPVPDGSAADLRPLDSDPIARAPLEPGPFAQARGGSRWPWAVTAIMAAILVVVTAAALWPRPAAAPAASSTPSVASGAVEVTCDSGWGPKAAGLLTPPRKSDLVWSPLWNPAPGRGPTTILFTDMGQWLGQLTPVFVPGGVASVVQVIGPSSARIVTFHDSRPAGDGFTSSDYADTGAMVASGRRIVPLPPCAAPDTYPLLIIAPDDACVHLQVTLAAGLVYPATVAIGSATCPRP